jgi:uncharacterized LabA/DUF88 family protein
MGVKLFDMKDIIQYSKKYSNKNLSDMTLIELGEGEFKVFNDEFDDELIKTFLNSNPRKWPKKCPKGRIGLYSKDFLRMTFNNVISIDTVSTCPKTLNINLIHDINDKKLNKQFDILTNFGTTEHVGQYDNIFENTQYHAFKNIHNLVKEKGIIFNVVPAYVKDNKKIHGAFHYTCDFFNQLAKLCNYTIVYNEVKARGIVDHVYCYFIKNDDKEFITEKQFLTIKGFFLTKHVKPEVKRYYDKYIV